MIKSGKYKGLRVVGGIQVGLTSIEIYGFNYDGIINSELLPNTYNDMVLCKWSFEPAPRWRKLYYVGQDSIPTFKIHGQAFSLNDSIRI